MLDAAHRPMLDATERGGEASAAQAAPGEAASAGRGGKRREAKKFLQSHKSDGSGHMAALLERIEAKTAVIGVMGMGYVGPPPHSIVHEP